MNVRLFGVVAAMSAMALVACGDDTGGSGTGGGTGTGSGGGATGTGGEAATTAATTTAASTGSGGGGDEFTCGAECADDPGCDLDPPDPGDECGGCVQAEGDKGTSSPCAVEGALGECCQGADGETPCADYVTCVLADDPDVVCEDDFPEGAARASACVLSTCGGCGPPE
jgi:hypothetical protein